jgi:hypothetical protein
MTGFQQPHGLRIARRSGYITSIATTLLIACGSSMLSGCTIPSDCGDLDYPTYGGAWQRTRRDSGRVGSIFDPAGARAPSLTARDDPSEDAEGRAMRDSILSAPPSGDAAQPQPQRSDQQREEQPAPSPSDQFDRDRLRALDLDEINLEPGNPAPPYLN